MNGKEYTKGFTLMELLVALAIIAVFASIVMATLNTARQRGRDTKRIQDASAMLRAVELYFDDNDAYPNQNRADSSGNPAWSGLETDLTGYIELPQDPLNTGNYTYKYDSDTGDNNQTYGFMVKLESNTNDNLVNNDGGFYNSQGAAGEYYEVGNQPAYCQEQYGENWWTPSAAGLVCQTQN